MNADEDLMEHPFYWLCRVCENERKKDISANNNGAPSEEKKIKSRSLIII